MTSFFQDVVFGFRVLIKNPAVTVIAVVSLALGIAANTTVFSLIDATLLGSLPFPEPERIVMLWNYPLQRPEARGSVGAQNYFTWKSESRSFDAMGAVYFYTRNLGADQGNPAERVCKANS
jgi:putative ABC transport system permease protein